MCNDAIAAVRQLAKVSYFRGVGVNRAACSAVALPKWVPFDDIDCEVIEVEVISYERVMWSSLGRLFFARIRPI